METSTITKSETKVKYKKPNRWKIIFHNDDKTTMEYVVLLLKMVFEKDDKTANELMMKVHKEGCAVVGLYTKERADQLLQMATAFKLRYNEVIKAVGDTHFSQLKITMEEE